MVDENDDSFDEDESKLVKDLRKQLKAKQERDAGELEELNQLRAERRQRNVSEVLKAKGARPEFAKFYSSDDSSTEAVEKWVSENSDLLGIGSDDVTDADTKDAASKISNATANAPTVKIGSNDELLHMLNTLPYEELVKRDLLPSANHPNIR